MRNTLLGAAFVMVMAAASVLVYAQLDRELDPIVPVTVLADRSGLLMEPGAAVKVLGVVVGRVRSVRATGTGATLSVGLDPSQAGRVPADARARIVSPTVFGAKYVELIRPTGRHTVPISAGAVIGRADVTVEINTTFQHVLDLLAAAEPSKFDAALTALADALRGNGTRLREVISDLDGYLGGLNPSLPALHSDLEAAPAVLGTYTDITPDLLRIGANVGFTSDTVVGRRAQLATFLLSLADIGQHTAAFLTDTEHPFVSTLDVLRPANRLLARYSAMFPCLFAGLDANRVLLDKVVDGGGLNVVLAPGLGAEPYHYPEDLPTIARTGGPNCHGLPNSPAAVSTGQRPGADHPSLADVLFGAAVSR